MVRSLLTRVLFVALVLALASPAFAKPRPDRIVKETVDLAEGEPLRVAFDGKLATCERWDCFLHIKEGKDETLHVEVFGDGQWVAYEKAAKDEDEGEGDDDDSAKNDDDDSAGADDDDSADSWMDMPLLSVEERRRRSADNKRDPFTIEKQRGKLSEDGKFLVIPADLLPAGDFDVESNGFWGARLGEEEIGNGTKTGLVHVKR